MADLYGKCGSCMWGGINAISGGTLRECHRYPPQYAYEADDMIFFYFPEMPETEFCGEWKSNVLDPCPDGK